MMFNTKLMTIAALAAFIVVPGFASADEGTGRVSYFAKKQGRVVFQDRTQDTASAAQDTAAGQDNPAGIEPAAGDAQPVKTHHRTLSNRFRLPQK